MPSDPTAPCAEGADLCAATSPNQPASLPRAANLLYHDRNHMQRSVGEEGSHQVQVSALGNTQLAALPSYYLCQPDA